MLKKTTNIFNFNIFFVSLFFPLLFSLLFSFQVFSLTLRDYDKSPKSYYHLAKVIRSYKLKDLHTNLIDFLKASRPSRTVNSAGHKQARDFIINYLKKRVSTGSLNVIPFNPDVDYAIRMYEDSLKLLSENVTKKNDKLPKEFLELFHYTESMTDKLSQLKEIKGKNIVWEKIGTSAPNDFIVIGAHYDTIAINSKTGKLDLSIEQPGADNNGSGVAILLSLIEVLSELNLKKSIRVVFFDYGEFAGLGERSYAKLIKEEKAQNLNFRLFIRLSMLGHDSKISDKNKKYGNFNVFLSDKGSSTESFETSYAKGFEKNANRLTRSVDFEKVYSPFSKIIPDQYKLFSIPSLTFTQNWSTDFNEARIHSSRDIIESINIQTLFHSFQYLSMGISSDLLQL